NQVELKYYFAGTKKCGGGSPRIQLGISGDGDGTFNQFPGGPDQNAFGYLSDSNGFQTGCPFVPNNQWAHEDMTNSAPKRDLIQWNTTYGSGAFCTGGNPFLCTWAQMVTFFNTRLPNHRVLN